MANVLFKRLEDSSLLDDIPIVDGSLYVTKDGKLFIDYDNERHAIGGTPDTQMSSTSTNSVQNNVIKEYVDNVGDRVSVFEYNLITDGNAVKTGRQIDGEDEYVIRVNCGNMPNNTSKSVSLPISLANVKITKPIQLFGQSSNNEYPILQTGITWFVSAGNYLTITTTSDRSRFSCYVEIYYINNS